VPQLAAGVVSVQGAHKGSYSLQGGLSTDQEAIRDVAAPAGTLTAAPLRILRIDVSRCTSCGTVTGVAHVMQAEPSAVPSVQLP
jgi:hypothetical protein